MYRSATNSASGSRAEPPMNHDASINLKLFSDDKTSKGDTRGSTSAEANALRPPSNLVTRVSARDRRIVAFLRNGYVDQTPAAQMCSTTQNSQQLEPTKKGYDIIAK